MVLHLPLILALLIFLAIPESVRWLLAKDRFAEAREIVGKVAAVNRRPQPTFIAAQQRIEREDRPGFRDLFRPRPIAVRLCVMCYEWFAVTMVFYGISLSATTLSGDPYLNFFLQALIEFPAIFFTYIGTDFVGRRFILVFMQTLSGVCVIAASLLIGQPGMWGLQTFFNMTAKFGATSAFLTVYLYTSELFPTSIRGRAVGVCSMMARFGGIFALLLLALKSVWVPLPLIVFGVVATAAGLSALVFPETTGQELPETAEQAINIGNNSNFKLGSRNNGRR